MSHRGPPMSHVLCDQYEAPAHLAAWGCGWSPVCCELCFPPRRTKRSTHENAQAHTHATRSVVYCSKILPIARARWHLSRTREMDGAGDAGGTRSSPGWRKI